MREVECAWCGEAILIVATTTARAVYRLPSYSGLRMTRAGGGRFTTNTRRVLRFAISTFATRSRFEHCIDCMSAAAQTRIARIAQSTQSTRRSAEKTFDQSSRAEGAQDRRSKPARVTRAASG